MAAYRDPETEAYRRMQHRMDAERHHPEVEITDTGVSSVHDETPYEHAVAMGEHAYESEHIANLDRPEYGDLYHDYDENIN